MEYVPVVLLVGAAVLGVWLWGKAKAAAWKVANQKVLMRGAHQGGRQAVGTALTFTASATGAQIRAKVDGFGWAASAHSALTSTLYVPSATDTEIVFVSGSKLGQSFRSVLTMTDGGGGATGSYRVVAWKEGDGIVGDVSQMQILVDRIRRAITELDPQAAFATVDDTAVSGA